MIICDSWKSSEILRLKVCTAHPECLFAIALMVRCQNLKEHVLLFSLCNLGLRNDLLLLLHAISPHGVVVVGNWDLQPWESPRHGEITALVSLVLRKTEHLLRL